LLDFEIMIRSNRHSAPASSYKNEEMAELGKKGGEAKAAAAAATIIVPTQAELEEAYRKMLLHRTQCQNPACLRFVPDEEIRYRNEKPYCLKCVPFIKEIKLAEPEEKPVSTKSMVNSLAPENMDLKQRIARTEEKLSNMERLVQYLKKQIE
jgi:hypothetical protein